MIKTQEVTYKLTVTAYHDGDIDKNELRQKLLETLKKDNWDCVLEEVKSERFSTKANDKLRIISKNNSMN